MNAPKRLDQLLSLTRARLPASRKIFLEGRGLAQALGRLAVPPLPHPTLAGD